MHAKISSLTLIEIVSAVAPAGNTGPLASAAGHHHDAIAAGKNMATGQSDHQQGPQAAAVEQLSCPPSYALGEDTPQHPRQSLLLCWEPVTSANASAQPSRQPAAGTAGVLALASSGGGHADQLLSSGMVLRATTSDVSSSLAMPFSVSGAGLSNKQEGGGPPSEGPLASAAIGASEVLSLPSTVPYFSVCSESAPMQQDVVLVSNSGDEGGMLTAAAAATSPAEEASPSTSPSSNAGTNNPKTSVTLELLECGVCMERMQPPIYQCREGHTLCSSCRARLTSCPTCRSPELSIRCRALEVLAQCLTDVPCRFASYGCTYTMKYTEAPQHETRCLRRPLACLHADNGCAFEASPQQLAEHLLQQHGYEYKPTSTIQFACTPRNCRGSKRLKTKPSSTSAGAHAAGERTQQQSSGTQEEGEGEEEPSFSLDGCESFVWQQQLYHCFGKYFVLRVHRRVEGEASFYISLLALHPRHHCSRYSLQVSGNHRTYSFQGPVWSAARGPQELERVKDCLLLPENIALFLSGAKGSEQNLNAINLSITGEILPS
ncbi:hypothetical protein Esti_003237 [Eimeria stiedai]